MKLLIITLAPTLFKENKYYSYAPFVKEMDIWFSHASDIIILSPTAYKKKLLLKPFSRNNFNISSIPTIDFSSTKSAFKSVFYLPIIIYKMIIEMHKADHIHLRCPSNVGMIASLVQMLYPNKPKTTKYAGNWDPKAKQPWSYQFQKWILSNTFLTKNMKVLVYGDWPNQSKNIKPFFTASYSQDKIELKTIYTYNYPFKFMFVGTLSSGKRPLYVIKLVHLLMQQGVECRLDFYGEGAEYKKLEQYITDNKLSSLVQLHGNQTAKKVEEAYKKSDFLVLPSKSEGWPKVVAEAMFWGVIPIVTKISCVPWMLDFGERGIFLDIDLNKDAAIILNKLNNTQRLQLMAEKAQRWSHQYTLTNFEVEIKKLLL